jgi:hypothetical protein
MMQAFITEDGTLTVIPTSDTEAYALKQWRESDGVLDTAYTSRIDAFGTITTSSSPKKGTNQTMSQSPQDIVWLERQKRILEAIADHAPFTIRKDLTISKLLSLALESLPECPSTTKQEWLKDAVDSCLRGIQRTVLKEVSWNGAIEAPRRLPVPIALASGRNPDPSETSSNGWVYGGVLRGDLLRWHWQFTHYLLLESSGFTHWLPFDVECLPVRVES